MPDILHRQSKVKRKKNVVVLSTSRPLNCKRIDDDKEKLQIIKFYDFTKGGAGSVAESLQSPDQLNHCKSKSSRWVMVALSCMLDTARVNGKTVWCLKNDSGISNTF